MGHDPDAPDTPDRATDGHPKRHGPGRTRGLVNTPWALLHGHSPLLSDRVVAPSGVNLMWNTTTPLLGVVAAPLALLGGPVLAYNLTLLCVLVAN